MNLFNCFQAMAFYTMLPLLASYLFTNGYPIFGYVACVANFVGYVVLSFVINDYKN